MGTGISRTSATKLPVAVIGSLSGACRTGLTEGAAGGRDVSAVASSRSVSGRREIGAGMGALVETEARAAWAGAGGAATASSESAEGWDGSTGAGCKSVRRGWPRSDLTVSGRGSALVSRLSVSSQTVSEAKRGRDEAAASGSKRDGVRGWIASAEFSRRAARLSRNRFTGLTVHKQASIGRRREGPCFEGIDPLLISH